MAANFRSVNISHTSPLRDTQRDDAKVISPTTPRPSTAPQTLPPPPPVQTTMDDATTPTRATFAGNNATGMVQQKPLPNLPFPEAAKSNDDSTPTTSPEKKTHKRGSSQHSKRSRDSAEMDTGGSDDETLGDEDDAGSDAEGSLNADGTRSNKKKKGNQRFWCKDYPPCTLSFTRSEHLLRHIRKHTGERPFTCHCKRKFSRLDNLRQHAQTVHVNEDIPIDSLAATGTRFQRQIRTNQVPRGARSRASTASSAVAPPRGHSKSLSTSNIASMSSLAPGYPTTPDDIRRRPPPLVMADANARLSVESYHSVGSAQFSFRHASPSDYSTPTSATFSTGQSSPRWGSGMGSPATSYSRAHPMYPSGSRTPGRRLSVPVGGNPFQSPHGTGNVGRPPFAPGPSNASNSAALASPSSSYLASPTASTTSGWSRRESVTSAEEWRRRTWHPESSNFNAPGSRLSQVVTPSQLNPPLEPLPALNRNGPPQQAVRLPGINSLFPKSGQELSPPPRAPSPMMVDGRGPPAPLLPSASISDDYRSGPQWNTLRQRLNRLEINNTHPSGDGAGAWANEVQQEMQSRITHQPQSQPQAQSQSQQPQPRTYHQPPVVRFEPEPQVVGHAQHLPSTYSVPRGHQHTMSAPLISYQREPRRHGRFNGPVTVHEDRVLEGHGRPHGHGHDHVERLAHPNMNTFGFPLREEAERRRSENPDSIPFEALVAAATNEGSTATAC